MQLSKNSVIYCTKNWFYHQRSNDGKNGKTLKHDFKKKTLFPSAKGTDRVQGLRYEFWQKVREVCFKDLIFIDESGVNLAIIRLYARSLKDSIARGQKPNKRGKNVSLIGAISVNEVLTSVNLIGTNDTITFEPFIIWKIVQKLWKAGCVVMKNCTIYTSEKIEKAIKNQGAKLIYLSPYSPEFSPIEHLWSKLKNILRFIKTTNYWELAKAIEFAFNQVTLSDIWNWFTHCCYCTSFFWETLYAMYKKISSKGRRFF